MNFKLPNNMFNYPADINFYKQKEELYLKIRKKEGRIYDEETLKKLPYIEVNHKYFDEWLIRKKSAENLVKYLSEFNEQKIMDLGCGNGWFSNYLAERTNHNVFAVDLNLFELKQGANAFKNPKMHFIYGDIFSDFFVPHNFNFIVIASALQYFENLKKLLIRLSMSLAPQGEVHIIDSPVYNKDEIRNAKERTKKYYRKLGEPEMTDFYFHHSWNELEEFDYKIMNKRNIDFFRFFRSSSCINPFPWIRISRISIERN